jgi:hypothetical protein
LIEEGLASGSAGTWDELRVKFLTESGAVYPSRATKAKQRA